MIKINYLYIFIKMLHILLLIIQINLKDIVYPLLFLVVSKINVKSINKVLHY